MKRKLFTLLAIMMVIITLVSCTGKKTNSDDNTASVQNGKAGTTGYKAKDADNVNPKGVFPIVKTPIKLEIAMTQNPKVTDYENNKFTSYIEKKTGIDIVFNFLPAKDTATKINLMFASNELPEVFLGANIMSDNMLVDYSSQDMIVSLNPLIETYGDEIHRMWKEAALKDMKKIMTMPDGNIYAVPKYSEYTNGIWGSRMWINKTWLDTLGLKMPSSTDEFYNVLKAFKTGDPNKNNKNDEIPLTAIKTTGDIAYLMNAFIYHDSTNRYLLSNGKIDVAFNKPEWKEGLAYINQLCKEGLLDPGTFIQDKEQLTAIATQADALVGAVPNLAATQIMPVNAAKGRYKEYVAVPPLKGPKGVQYASYTPQLPMNAYVITSVCKSPAAAYRLADFMLSEEATIYGRYGEENVDWKKPSAGVLGINGKPAYLEIINNVWSLTNHNAHWQFPNPGFAPIKVQDGISWNNDPYNADYILFMAADTLYKGKEPKETAPQKLIMTPQEATEFSELQNAINTYVNEASTRFAIGDLNLASDWDNYIKELDKLKIKRYLELAQISYNRMAK